MGLQVAATSGYRCGIKSSFTFDHGSQFFHYRAGVLHGIHAFLHYAGCT